jgi:hypothetical protein
MTALLTELWESHGNLSRMKLGGNGRSKGTAAARVPSPGDTANPAELKDDSETYEHLQQLAKRSSRRNGTTLRRNSQRSPECPQFRAACYRD